jgi:hypothetical protein
MMRKDHAAPKGQRYKVQRVDYVLDTPDAHALRKLLPRCSGAIWPEFMARRRARRHPGIVLDK